MFKIKHLAPIIVLFLVFATGCGSEPSSSPSTDRPTDTLEAHRIPPDSASPSKNAASPWTTTTTERHASLSRPATLTAIHTEEHQAFDRVVFTFDEEVPGYRIAYVEGLVHACGSGKPVMVAGATQLKIHFYPARTYTKEGTSTVYETHRAPNLPILKELEMSCTGFEADVTWVLGLAASTQYRVRTRTNPARLVVDLRHPSE